jgi:hypothetical protein
MSVAAGVVIEHRTFFTTRSENRVKAARNLRAARGN